MGSTILNVNDDSSALHVKSRILRHAGFKVREASTGEAALAQITAAVPDLVLLDADLPDVSGSEVCRRIKAVSCTARLPVLEISATFRDEPGCIRGLEGGADLCLAEPVSPDLLVATIRALLRSAHRCEEACRDTERARTDAEIASDRLRRLHTITTALAEAMTTEEVLDTIADRAMAATGAATGVVALSEGGTELVTARIRGYPHETAVKLRRIPLDALLPVADANRTSAGVFVESATDSPRYRGIAKLKADVPAKAVAAVPLIGQGRTIGALGLRFRTRVTFDDNYRDFLTAIGRECGQALERARLYDAEHRLREELEQQICARKEAERSLGEAQERWKRLVDVMPAGVYTCDATGVITFCNERLVRIWGRQPQPTDRYCGSARLFYPDGRPVPRAEVPMALAIAENREIHNAEAVVERPDGSRVTALVNIVPIRDETGAAVGALNTSIDVTALKHAEERLSASNRRLAFLFESASGLLAAEDPREFLRQMYQHLHELLGVEISLLYSVQGNRTLCLDASYGLPEELTATYRHLAFGEMVCGKVAADQREFVLDRVQQQPAEKYAGLQALGITTYACFPLRAGERLIATLSFGLRSRDAFTEDELALLRSVADEVAIALRRRASTEERERLVRGLRESRDLLARTQEIGRTASFEFDPKTNSAMGPEALRRLYGLSPSHDPLTLEAWVECILPEDREFALAEVAATLTNGDRISQFRIRRPDTGEVRWMESRVSVVRDDAGTPVKIVGFNIDISEQKLAEEALRQRTAELDSLLSNAPLGFAFHDRQHRFLRINEELCKINGLPEEAHLGRPVSEVLPAIAAIVDPVFDQVVATGKPTQLEISSETPKEPGVVRHWLAGYYPVFGPSRREVAGTGAFVVEITERRRMEEALRDNEQRYRVVFQDSAIGMSRVRLADASWIEVNDAFCRMLGYTREEMQAKSFPEITYPEDIDSSLIPFRRMAAGELDSYVVEKRYIHKLGHLVWARLTVSLVRDAAGRPDYEIAVTEDITQRKQAEDALRESEQRYRSLFDSMQEGFFVAEIITDELGVPVDYRYLEANPAVERITGRPRRDVIGHPASEVLPGLGRQWIEAFGAVALTGQPAHIEHFATPLNRWFEAIAYSPRPGQFATTFLDITDRKRGEESLREGERSLRELADSMPQLVWTTDEKGYVTYVNRQWCEQLGLSTEQSLGERWADALHPEDRESCLAYAHQCASTGELYQTEYRLRIANGEYHWFLARGVPIRNEQGRITGWYGTSTDIHESKHAEERLRQAQKLESIGVLAGGIAHDFNNLLTGILGNASMVLDEVDPEPAENIRAIVTNAERAAHLTRQLLAYSGKGQFVVRDIDVSEMVHDIGGLVQFSIPKSVELQVSVQKRLPMVRMDPGQLEQVLMNLIINAGEAIGEGNPGRITVATSMIEVAEPFLDAVGQEIVTGRYVAIEVTDTGSGIDQEGVSKIFDPFFTTKFTGRGLGLAAVAGIVRSQQGAITVRSMPGKGSTFRVLLRAAEFGAQKRPLRIDSMGGDRGTILVVDDDSSVRQFINGALRREGYRVLEAIDGRDALGIFDRENGQIDGVVLDVVMPVMGANELLPGLRARRPSLGILLTSGYSETEARRLSAAYPGVAFIQKPYTAGQIVKALQNVLGASKSNHV